MQQNKSAVASMACCGGVSFALKIAIVYVCNVSSRTVIIDARCVCSDVGGELRRCKSEVICEMGESKAHARIAERACQRKSGP